MSEIYEVIEIHEPLDGDTDEFRNEIFLDFWEKTGNKLTLARFRRKELPIIDNDICKTLKETFYKKIFEEEDSDLKIDLIVRKTNQKVGHYYPRIFIPVFTYTHLSIFKKDEESNLKNNLPIDEYQLIKSLEQLSTLIDFLKKIFQTVYPAENNFDTFGFDIRNLIILSCTEFESQVKGILVENGIRNQGNFYTTRDYVKLAEIMKLSKYSVKYRYYPDLQCFKPFDSWSSDEPTKSIRWYSNYNKIKHDRDTEFDKGTLQDLLYSISACFVILLAQYGEHSVISDITNNFFEVVEIPDWKRTEKLLAPRNEKDWIKKKYSG